MSVSLAPSPVFQGIGFGGLPVPFGKLFTYIAGTNTPQATWTDATETQQNTNPVALNANGQANVWFDNALTYKVKLTDALDNQVYIVDQIPGGITAGEVIAVLSQQILGEIIYPQTAAELAAGVTPTFFTYPPGDVRRYGAIGDGVNDDTLAIQTAFNTLQPVIIPWTQNAYLFSSTITVMSNVLCTGQLIAKSGFSSTAITFANPGFGVPRTVQGLRVTHTDIRPVNSIGIFVGFSTITLDRCSVNRFWIGTQLACNALQMLNCMMQLNDTNLSMYAPTPSGEINSILVSGGSYDSATTYAVNIGDPRFPSTIVPPNPQGVSINFIGNNFDGAPFVIDSVYAVSFDACYFETVSGQNAAIIIGNATNANTVQDVTLTNCFFNGFNYAVLLNNTTIALQINPCTYIGVKYCALYAVGCESQGFVYHSGSSTGSFANGAPQVHTGFSNGANTSQATFNGITLDFDFLSQGVQLAQSLASTTNWYPNGKTLDGNTQLASAFGRFRSGAAVQTGILGTQSGNVFTFLTPSQAAFFNGGDRITGAGSSSYVKNVNYVAGSMVVDGTASGAQTVSHDTVFFRNINIFGTAAPTTGTWKQGDLVYQSAPTSGGFIGFVCTVSGSPGTWKTWGVIS